MIYICQSAFTMLMANNTAAETAKPTVSTSRAPKRSLSQPLVAGGAEHDIAVARQADQNGAMLAPQEFQHVVESFAPEIFRHRCDDQLRSLVEPHERREHVTDARVQRRARQHAAGNLTA